MTTLAETMRTCVLQTLLLLTLLASDSYGSGEIHDYCPQDYFDVTCGSDEVIQMKSASYGRMRRVRCITGNYQMGCSVDVLAFFDRKCSGRKHCKVYVADPFLHTKKPCGKDLSSYLEAAYTCIPVGGAGRTRCRAPIPLTLPSSYIASSKTTQYGLGTSDCPWVITAKEGQQITIFLYTYGGRADEGPSESSADVCYELGTVKEAGAAPTLLTSCSGKRYREVYASAGNVVQIELLSPDILKELVPFVIFYEAVGCEKLLAPPGGWLQTDGENAEIGCHHSPEVWYMTCQGSQWIGQTGNCSTGEPIVDEQTTQFPYGILIVVAIGVALGVFFGGALLTVVAVYMKGRHRQQEERESTTMESPYQQCHLATKHTHIGAYDDTVAIRMGSSDPYNTSKTLADQDLYNTQRKSGHVYESPQFS